MRKHTLLLFLLLLSCVLDAQTQYGWVQKATFSGTGRHRASGASVGNRGYLGLGHINAVVDILYDDWWEYDPGSDTWTQKANYGGGLRYHAVAFTIGNFIYVGTGRDPNVVLHTDFWKFDPVNNNWVQVASLPGSARRGAVAFTLNGFGYVGTGSYYADFFKYDPGNNTWSPIAAFPGQGRTSAVGIAINSKGYVGTGDVGGNTGDWWEYNPSNNQWTAKANLAGLPRMEAAAFELNGIGYVGTGDDFSSGNNYQDFWAYNPTNNSWVQVTDFGGAARRYLTTFTIGNRAYAGTGTSGINYQDFWEFGTISDIPETTNQVLNFTVSPNPITDRAEIRIDEDADWTFELLSLDGKLIRSENIVQRNLYAFERGDLVAGMYLLRIYTANGKTGTQKLLIH